ncbi:MAG: hypothetical protein NTV93_11210 [Verrucomicrobia bacterium]|nr:hypothetical protein [Verrucomicrobiota bacterium]
MESNIASARECVSVHEFRALTTIGEWTEVWPDADGKPQKRDVVGELWNAAIQVALDQSGGVRLPKQDQPYYLDRPIILRSGQHLVADPLAEIRLKPGTNTCMVRNEQIVGFQDRAVPADLQPDHDIVIQGGIWTTLATMPSESNGNNRGRADADDSVPGCHGVILLQNVERVVVRDLTIRASKPFGVHIGTAKDFLIDNLAYEEHRRDGVHCDGPACYGIIRNISGWTGDDPVSLLAWDWRQYSASFGPIHHILVEKVSGAPSETESYDSVRLLPGLKQFADGAKLDCPISDCVLRDLTDIRAFKLYDQPNLEQGRDNDASAAIGELRNLHFERLAFNRPGNIQVHADTDGLSLRDVRLNFPVPSDYHLLQIGPQSLTYDHGSEDPARWVEIFSPDRDCTVRNLSVTRVRALDVGGDMAIDDLVQIITQKPNPDYPKSKPRGGTGRGIWIRDQQQPS